MALIKKVKMRDCNITLMSTVAVRRSIAQQFSVASAVIVWENHSCTLCGVFSFHKSLRKLGKCQI